MLGNDKILSLLRKILDAAPGDQKEALYNGGTEGLTRFAESNIHQHMVMQSSTVYFRIARGKRVGCASTSSLDEESLRRSAEAAHEMARHQPEIPHFPGFAQPEKTRRVKGHFHATAKMNPRQKAKVMKGIFERAAKHDLRMAGSFSTAEEEIAVVNSNGVAHYQPLSAAAMSLFALSEDSSGFAHDYRRDVRRMDFAALAERAIEKAAAGRRPRDIEPGVYDVVLEPAAVSEVMEWMAFTAFGAKAWQDGMSFIEGNVGKPVMGENVTIYDNALEREGMPMSFDFEGTPKRKVYLVKDGRARGVVHDRLSAAQAGAESTGSALPPGNAERALPVNLFMEAGDAEEKDMLSALGRGIWVTKFHYLNGYLDPKKALMTGMTRDGAFWVEDGKIRHGITNMRFTQGMLEAFGRIEKISKERRPVKTWWSSVGANTMPTLLIRGFRFTGRQEKR